MALNQVTPADIASRWRPLTDMETATAEALLGDAWAMLVARADNLLSDLDAGNLDQALVRAVMTAAVLRVMKNPDGNRTESIDDYSWTRDTAVSAGLLYFTDAEIELIRGVRPAAVSLDTANDTERDNYWWPW